MVFTSVSFTFNTIVAVGYSVSELDAATVARARGNVQSAGISAYSIETITGSF